MLSLVLVGLVTSCTSGIITEQFREQVSIDEVSTGQSNALRATVIAGNVQDDENDNDTIRVKFWSSGPMPSVLFENGVDGEPTRIDMTLYNAGIEDGSFVLSSLPEEAAQQSGCRGVVRSAYFAPAPPNRADTTLEMHLIFDLASCSTLSFTPNLTREQGETYRVALVGSVSEEILANVLRSVSPDRFDYVQFFGSVALGRDGTPYDTFLNAVCPGFPACSPDEGGLHVPFGVAMGADDSNIRDHFYSHFGQTDFLTHIGDVPFLALNTSLGALSEGQFAFISSIPVGGPPGIVVMQIPPFGVSPIRHQGLRNAQEAARLQSLLEARNFRWIVSTSPDGYDDFVVGATRVFAIPADGGYAELVLRHADSYGVTCDHDTPCGDPDELCVGGFCEHACAEDAECDARLGCDLRLGYCRQPCDEESRCLGGTCGADGYCVAGPSVAVTWQPWEL